MSKHHVNDHPDQQKLINKALGKKIPRDKIMSKIKKDPVLYDLFDKFSAEDKEKVIAFLAGEQTLQILYDKFFKKILGPEVFPERMESLLSAIFGEEVRIVDILQPEGIALTEGGSQVIRMPRGTVLFGTFFRIDIKKTGNHPYRQPPGHKRLIYIIFDKAQRSVNFLF